MRDTLRLMSKVTKTYKSAPAVRELALSLVNGLQNKDWRGEVRRIHAFVQNRIRYVRDVRGVETVQSPVQTLRIGQGDCDDQAVLVASLLEAIGHPTRFVAIGMKPDFFSHVFAQTRIGNKWVTVETTEPWPVGRHPRNVKTQMVEHN